MRRTLIALVLALSFAAPAASQTSSNLAPADRYFGRLKMSILGVRNALKDLSARADAQPDQAEHIYDKAVLVEDALRDWQRHFPRDPWIPKYAYALAQLYGKLEAMDDARVRKNDTLDWLIATYPESEYAQLPRD
jgi:TolA-binding protein